MSVGYTKPLHKICPGGAPLAVHACGTVSWRVCAKAVRRRALEQALTVKEVKHMTGQLPVVLNRGTFAVRTTPVARSTVAVPDASRFWLFFTVF